MFDAIVIGAGPAGSHTAQRLAEAGHGVLVLEKDAAPGLNVCCTGIIGAPCLSLLDVPPELVYGESRAARFIAPAGHALSLHRDEPVAYVVDRPGLDRLLAERGAEAGATYRYGARVLGLQGDGCGVNVTLGGAEVLRARSVVIATGFGSTLTRHVGLGQLGESVLGVQADVPCADLTGVEIHLSRAHAPGGFAWALPSAPGRAWVGMIAARGRRPNIQGFLSHLTKRGVIAGAVGPLCYGAIPVAPLERSVADRILVVGEAAGHIKPTTGGGIYYGVLAGAMAAEVLDRGLRADRLGARDLMAYEVLWRGRLGPELRAGRRAQRLFSHLGDPEIDALMSLALRRDLPQAVARSPHFSFDDHGPLIRQLSALLPVALPRPRAGRAEAAGVGAGPLS